MSPSTVAVGTSIVTLVEPGSTAKHQSIFIARQDADSRRVMLSIGTKDFTAATAALWLEPGERLQIFKDAAQWPLVAQGIYAVLATGANIDVNIQLS